MQNTHDFFTHFSNSVLQDIQQCVGKVRVRLHDDSETGHSCLTCLPGGVRHGSYHPTQPLSIERGSVD